jgi:cytochrome b
MTRITMQKNLIYDFPMRLFHWIFAGLFVTAFLIAKSIDDDSTIYSYHMLAGLLLGAVVLLRIFWGLVGSRYSRFSSFALHPRELVSYFLGLLNKENYRWVGHNPASSWGTLMMLVLGLSLACTGYLMSIGYEEVFEDIHEVLANGFLIVVVLHVFGVLLHSFRHRDGLAWSMVNGAKDAVPEGAAVASSRPWSGIMFLILVFVVGFYLVTQFDSQTRSLNLFGQSLQLGESQTESDD